MSQRGNINIPLLIVIIVASLVAYFFFNKYSDTAELLDLYQSHSSTVTKRPASSSSAEATGLKTYTDNGFGYSIKYPEKYQVTTGDEIVYKGSQGGMAPPLLFLTEGYRPLAENDADDKNYTTRYQKVIKRGANCILVWSTKGFPEIERWEEMLYYQQPFKIISESIENIGSLNFTTRQLENVYGSEILESYVNFGEQSYYFNTCNQNNKSDLETVLSSFKLTK
jgi:hypothetical protein